MFKLVVFVLSVAIISCSGKDRGVKFSPNYQEKIGAQEKVKSVNNGCIFPEVNFVSDSLPYGAHTEEKINQLLNKYVTPLNDLNSVQLSGQVKYASWFLNLEDKKILCEVVENIRNTEPKNLSLLDQKVFFINSYNILTIELILSNYFDVDNNSDLDSYRRSIRNIRDFGETVWDRFVWKIGSENYTLNQIEKEILIPMGDARIHFAINCASRGCPPLRNEAFTIDKLDQQLDEMSDFFVSSEAYSFYDYAPENGSFFEVSSLFEWYEIDFQQDISGRYGGIREFVAFHLQSNIEDLGFSKEEIVDASLWDIEFANYSWELNEDESN